MKFGVIIGAPILLVPQAAHVAIYIEALWASQLLYLPLPSTQSQTIKSQQCQIGIGASEVDEQQILDSNLSNQLLAFDNLPDYYLLILSITSPYLKPY